MERVIFLFLRRMRAPLLTLIFSYTVSITGLVLIPGVDAQGQVWHYDFFHAFYFVSFMGTTIGFGEVPYEMVPAQRMWVAFSIYLTVISWLFALGKIFALVQDQAFARAITEARFIRAVRKITEPFYIVCGYGETGSLVVRALVNRGIRCVVIDDDPDHIANLQLEELSLDVPCFCGDASSAQHLKEAGLNRVRGSGRALNPGYCAGVLAMTGSDEANVKIAVISKLLQPGLTVVCRAASRAAANNMDSFDTDVIINPFESFAAHTGMAIRTPHTYLLHRWLVALPNRDLDPPLRPPRGMWVICGYGRFGQAMARYLSAEGIEVRVIEVDKTRVQETGSARPDLVVVGSGTDPEPLHEAGVESAVGIVAGTESDANNLSVILTAREINPGIFQVARQNQSEDKEIFASAGLDLVMEPSRVIAWQVLSRITVPMLESFLALARREDDEWARELLLSIRTMTGELTPQTWMQQCDEAHAPAITQLRAKGYEVCLRDLLSDPLSRSQRLPAMVLLHQRGDESILMPPEAQSVEPGDRLLWTSRLGFRERLMWLLHNQDQLAFVIDGRERPTGYVGRWFARRCKQRAGAAVR